MFVHYHNVELNCRKQQLISSSKFCWARSLKSYESRLKLLINNAITTFALKSCKKSFILAWDIPKVESFCHAQAEPGSANLRTVQGRVKTIPVTWPILIGPGHALREIQYVTQGKFDFGDCMSPYLSQQFSAACYQLPTSRIRNLAKRQDHW